ncbi:hypothetical protein, partial [Microbulbifer sp.]|uniref:hypothetical protein n=1 Tax=Microbulbifer sp. TaxID=1908541 RepID=UPI002F936730
HLDLTSWFIERSPPSGADLALPHGRNIVSVRSRSKGLAATNFAAAAPDHQITWSSPLLAVKKYPVR